MNIGYNIEVLAVYYIGFLENLYQNNKHQILLSECARVL